MVFFTNCWNGNGRWKGYKATTVMMTCGLLKAFLDNYWVLTPVPLASEEGDEAASKACYMLAQILVTTTLAAGAGLGLDYLRSIYSDLNREETGFHIIAP